MFSTHIASTAFSSKDADAFFDNITEQNMRFGDATFISTLRALCESRMKSGETIRVYQEVTRYRAEEINGSPIRSVIDALCRNILSHQDEEGCIFLHNFGSRKQEDNLACLSVLNSEFTNIFSDWEHVPKVTAFYKSQFEVTCFINRNRRQVVYFVDRIDNRIFHYLQCSIFVAMPWYFDPSAGVTEDEMNLIKSLKDTDEKEYLRCLSLIADKYDLRKLKIEKLLKGVESKISKVEMQKVKEELESVLTSINDHNRIIRELFLRKRNLDVRLFGLNAYSKSNENQSEIMEYFLCNKKIDLLSVEDDTITFVTKDYFTYFDEECAKAAINNEDSVIYYDDDEEEERSDLPIGELMNAIFVDRTIKMKVIAAFRLSLRGGVSPIQGYDYQRFFDNGEYMPNPHLDGYSCLGGYNEVINVLSRDHNYIGIIEQCMASCKSLDFGDYTVMNHFMRDICDSNLSCYELPDGSVVNMEKALDWIDGKYKTSKKDEAKTVIQKSDEERGESNE